MKEWFKKYYWIPLLALIGGGAWAYFYFRKPENRISFGFNSDNDLASLLPVLESRYANRTSDSSAQKGIGVYLDVPLTAIVKNRGMKELVLNNIGGTLAYEGENILQTKGDSKALQTVKVEGKGQKPITDTFQVLVNGKTIKYIREQLKGKKPKLNYNLTAMILGDVYSFRDSAILNENAPSTTK